MTSHRHPDDLDRGTALPLVLVITVVLSVVVLGIATYSTTSLRYATVVEDRSDALSAADAGMRYAIDQLKLRNAGCILDTQEAQLPGVDADFNDATATVVCERVTSGFEGIQAFAAVMTAEGLNSNTSLLSSQSGSNAKVLGGPVYMSRITDQAFDLTPPVRIEDGPLLYHDTTGDVPCRSKKPSEIAAVGAGTLIFEPELIFGPVCVTVPWTQLFDSPTVPDLTALPIRDGGVSIATDPVTGSYVDVSGGGCRVFLPGNYVSPPDQRGHDAYFQTGDYLFDFQGADKELLIRQGTATAGRVNLDVTTSGLNELDAEMSAQCTAQQAADPAPAGEYGATFYFGGGSHIDVATQGSLEIHARVQGTDYVSVQTLCAPNGIWCNPDGDGGMVGSGSTITAPSNGSMPDFLFTDSGNNKEFVAQALVYAPLGQVEFGNVSNTATQKMLGGLIVSRLVLQSSTSATNFEIAVPTSPITAVIQLTSTAVKNGKITSIQAVTEYRPYEDDIDDRVRINSWRVCEDFNCT